MYDRLIQARSIDGDNGYDKKRSWIERVAGYLTMPYQVPRLL
jgi:hypothetical protein